MRREEEQCVLPVEPQTSYRSQLYCEESFDYMSGKAQLLCFAHAKKRGGGFTVMSFLFIYYNRNSCAICADFLAILEKSKYWGNEATPTKIGRDFNHVV